MRINVVGIFVLLVSMMSDMNPVNLVEAKGKKDKSNKTTPKSSPSFGGATFGSRSAPDLSSYNPFQSTSISFSKGKAPKTAQYAQRTASYNPAPRFTTTNTYPFQKFSFDYSKGKGSKAAKSVQRAASYNPVFRSTYPSQSTSSGRYANSKAPKTPQSTQRGGDQFRPFPSTSDTREIYETSASSLAYAPSSSLEHALSSGHIYVKAKGKDKKGELSGKIYQYDENGKRQHMTTPSGQKLYAKKGQIYAKGKSKKEGKKKSKRKVYYNTFDEVFRGSSDGATTVQPGRPWNNGKGRGLCADGSRPYNGMCKDGTWAMPPGQREPTPTPTPPLADTYDTYYSDYVVDESLDEGYNSDFQSECAPVMCMMFCPSGFVLDANGCELCMCAQDSPSTVSTLPLDPPFDASDSASEYLDYFDGIGSDEVYNEYDYSNEYEDFYSEYYYFDEDAPVPPQPTAPTAVPSATPTEPPAQYMSTLLTKSIPSYQYSSRSFPRPSYTSNSWGWG